VPAWSPSISLTTTSAPEYDDSTPETMPSRAADATAPVVTTNATPMTTATTAAT
jgi:hypothetical protein